MNTQDASSAQPILAVVDFHGQSLTAAVINDIPHVAMKPICENIGLDWAAQVQRLKRNDVLNSTVVMTTTVAEDGKQREMLMLPLDYLNGWLFGVDASRVKPEIRPRLLEYQRECFKVLANHFMPKRNGLVQLPEPKTKKALPGGLSLDQQDCIKALVKSRIEHLPKDKQGGAAIKCWSAIKTKFGKSYKAVEPENFSAIVSLVGRVPIEGELLGKAEQLQDPLLADSDYRAEAREAINQHLNSCHAAMRKAGVEPPKWPTLDEKTIDGLAAGSMLLHRWIASFDPQTMKMRLTSIPNDAMVMNESEWIRYMTQERGFIVVKRSEVADKLMA